MAISLSGSMSGASLGAGPVAGSDPQDERISGDGVDCSGLGIVLANPHSWGILGALFPGNLRPFED